MDDPLSADAVCEAYRARVGVPSDEHALRASRVPGTSLWTVGDFDSQGRPNPGAASLVGPDLQLWSLSSNPGIHDFDLAVTLLEAAYGEGLANALAPASFVERVQDLTVRRTEDIQQFKADLKAGALSDRKRHLP